MNDISKYENIAMLDLSETERERLGAMVVAMADGFNEIEKIDTEGALPLVTVLDATNIMREDIAIKLVSRDELMEKAPEHQDGYYKVPATLD